MADLDVAGLANPSPFGRLVAGVSWQGAGVSRFRDGGVGHARVLNAEVLYALDMLPRTAFLAQILAAAHGADAARAVVAAGVESATLDTSADEVYLNPTASSRSKRLVVQPDALLQSDDAYAVLELRPPRPRAVRHIQLARLAATAVVGADGRTPLLLLVLSKPPPLTVTGRGRLDVVEAVELGLAEVLAAAGSEALVGAADVVAWVSWAEVADVVRRQAAAFDVGDSSTERAVRRLARALDDSVRVHSAPRTQAAGRT